jgi:hypothetical protein
MWTPRQSRTEQEHEEVYVRRGGGQVVQIGTVKSPLALNTKLVLHVHF